MNNVKTVQNKLRAALGYTVPSTEILNYLAQIGIEAKSLSSDLTDEEINKGVTYITTQIAQQQDGDLSTEVLETEVPKVEAKPGEIVYSKAQIQSELKTMADTMEIEIVESEIVDIANKNSNIFTSRKEMLNTLAEVLKDYVSYQLSKDEDAFRVVVKDGITRDVKQSNAAVLNMVADMQKEVEAGNGALKRGIDKMRSILAIPTS